MTNFIYDKLTQTKNSISINSFDISIQNLILFKDAKLSLSNKSIYGLIGRNGIGKTTLLKELSQITNQDYYKYSLKVNILYIEQLPSEVLETILTNELENTILTPENTILTPENTILTLENTPINYILNCNYKLIECQEKLKQVNDIMYSDEFADYDEEAIDLMISKEESLNQIIKMWNPELEKVKIKKILLGLGFTENDLVKPCNLFSGGWQMRITLAKALYFEPDILLLDEPTNHLDLEAIIWLSNYLNEWNNTCIVVSHNIGFLNDVSDYILNIEDKKLVQYKGNYTGFKMNLIAKLKNQEKEWGKYEKKLKEMKAKGIDKQKIINYITKNEVKKPEKPLNICMNFKNQNIINMNIITFNNVSFGYDKNNLLLDKISFGLDMNTKIALVGKNGSGKSTLIKLLVKELEPISGEVWINSNCKIGYYNQHFESQLPYNENPVEYLSKLIPLELIKNNNILHTIRGYLGLIKLNPSNHYTEIKNLSGGQKARVALIKLIFTLPHCLILDEPTNHLDIETVEILIEALISFKGCVIVITHESELINKLNDQIWMVDSNLKNINYNINSYTDYCKLI